MELVRQDRLLAYLQEHDRLTVDDAAEMLKVSVITVRRDFRSLAERGLVRRTRGAILAPPQQSALPFAMRESRNSAAKLRLAQAAAALIQPNDVVFVDGGTTTFFLSGCLPDQPFKIITHSVRLAAHVDEHRQGRAWPEIHLTGGMLYPELGLLLGPTTRRTLRDHRARLAILSIGGIDEHGITNTHEMVAEIERIMIRQSTTVVVVADRSKLGKPAMCKVCGLSGVDLLITDATVEDEPMLAKIRAAGVEVQVVGQGG